MTPTRTALLALAFTMAITTAAAAGSARTHIEANLGQFEAAFNSGNAAGVAALYTEDGVLLPPGGARVDGRAAVQDFWQGAIDGGISGLDLDAVEVEENGDLAYEVGVFSLDAPGENGATVTVSGKYIVVWKKTGQGVWQLHRDIWNLDPPPAAQ